MADWNTPTLTSTYTSVIDTFKNRDIDSAVMFNPTYATALTNFPTGTIRWSSAGATWELYNGTSWGALAALHNINVDKLDGQDGTYYLAWANLTGKPTTFAPSAHTHDDRYYTETESDARYGNNLFVSGNTVQLRTAGGATLTSITVPYAVSAGSTASTGSFSIGQDLLTTSSPTFGNIVGTDFITGMDGVQTGQLGQAISIVNFYDNAGSVFRDLRYNSGVAERWQVEHTDGTYKNLFHEAHVPDWTEVANKPTTFTATAHGHAFDQTNKLQVHRAATATLNAITGLQGEVAFDTSTGRLRAFNGALAGGFPVALQSELANYAPINVIPAGATMFTAASTAPEGWIKANGALVSRTAYAALFAAIGTTYGAGNGTTTFQLPDMRGVVPRGLDELKGYDTGRTLGSYQADQFETHTHSASSATAGSHAHTVNDTGHTHTVAEIGGNSGTGNGEGYGGNGFQLRSFTRTTSSSTTGLTVNVTTAHSHTITVSDPATGKTGTETRMKNIALLPCIKF